MFGACQYLSPFYIVLSMKLVSHVMTACAVPYGIHTIVFPFLCKLYYFTLF